MKSKIRSRVLVAVLALALMVSSIGSGGIAAADNAGIAAADIGEVIYTDIGEVVYSRLVLRGFREPISLAEIKGIIAEARARVNAFRLKAQAPLLSEVLAVPKLEVGEVIVAFGVVVGCDGVVREYLGTVMCGRSAEGIHRRARMWYRYGAQGLRRYRHGAQGLRRGFEKSNPSVTSATEPQSNPSGGGSEPEGWVRVWYRWRERCWEPRGMINTWMQVFQQPQDGSTCHDWFAISEDFAMTPGRILWDSDWDNCRGWLTHNWGVDGGKAKELLVWAPKGTLTGEQTISVSLGKAPALIWSYHQPNVTTYDLTNPLEDYMRRKIVFRAGAARRTTGGMNPGSLAVAPQYRDGRLRRLAEVRTEGRFRRPWRRATIRLLTSIWIRAQDV